MCLDIKISDDIMVEMDEVFLLTAHSLAPNVNIINTALPLLLSSIVMVGEILMCDHCTNVALACFNPIYRLCHYYHGP